MYVPLVGRTFWVWVPSLTLIVSVQSQNLQDLSVEAKYLRDYRKYNPHTFDRSLKDPTKAELWLSSIETIFQIYEVPRGPKDAVCRFCAD